MVKYYIYLKVIVGKKKTNLKLEAIKVEHSSQLETVFENINDGYISMDLFGNVQQMNNNEYDIKSIIYENENLKENLNIKECFTAFLLLKECIFVIMWGRKSISRQNLPDLKQYGYNRVIGAAWFFFHKKIN